MPLFRGRRPGPLVRRPLLIFLGHLVRQDHWGFLGSVAATSRRTTEAALTRKSEESGCCGKDGEGSRMLAACDTGQDRLSQPWTALNRRGMSYKTDDVVTPNWNRIELMGGIRPAQIAVRAGRNGYAVGLSPIRRGRAHFPPSRHGGGQLVERTGIIYSLRLPDPAASFSALG